MKIINSMWITPSGGYQMGLVVTENETTGERKIRGGAITPIEATGTEEMCAESIASTGGVVSLEMLKQLIADVEGGK